MSTSVILGVNSEIQKIQSLASVFDRELGEWSMKYLGIPLGINPVRVSFWVPIVLKVGKHLDGWEKSKSNL